MNKQKLDLDQIEDELEKISPWPWDGVCIEYIRSEGKMILGDYDTEFINNAPQRIAILVKRVRELEAELKIHKRLSTLGCAMSLEAMEFKRASDEV